MFGKSPFGVISPINHGVFLTCIGQAADP